MFGFSGAGFGGQGFGGFGFGGQGGFGQGGPECGGGFGQGFGGQGFGPGGFGPGGRLKRAATAAAALLSEGPATAEQLAERVSEATDGAFTPPADKVEFVLNLLEARGVATRADGVATLTEFGEQLLAFRGVNSETVRTFLGQISKFADGIKLRKNLFEFAGLARTIAFTGTDDQKVALTEAIAGISDAVTAAKKSLYRALAAE